MSPAVSTLERCSARVEGIVQGVGFRPYVYKLAVSLGLAGFILNDERGVLIEVEGEPATIAAFLEQLPAEAPPLARIERVRPERIEPAGERGFAIVPSRGEGTPETQISPDSATCEDCLAEIRDSGDRRYRYPFTNCTNCGPRFTIVAGIPYDRPMTTMARFEMCRACRAEYEDPADRRFHAQPNACSECGPSVRLLTPSGEVADDGGDAVAATAEALVAGLVVAIKGIGGYHLACRADAEDVVAGLRARKRREEKPFALMARDLAAAEALVDLDPCDRELLCGPQRPIVIARRRDPGGDSDRVAPSVAPGNPDLGVMLPYSPLHHLLIADAGIDLVMTSANLSDEPIAYDDEDARARLGEVADRFCVHDRPIHTRTDDSVVRSLSLPPEVREPGPLIMRRSRGWVPGALPLPIEPEAPVLACGAELKSTFALARGGRAWVSHHIGDLKNYETLCSFREGVEHFQRLFELEPEIVACDMHPDYLSTTYASERSGVRHLAVQHHHAHLAAVLAEHGLAGPAVGAIYDGSGYGPDGTVWGGELLTGGLDGYERSGLLFPVRLPGGDKAVEQPWRMACAWLTAVGDGDPGPPPPPLAELVDRAGWEAVAGICRTGLASPLTTSAGRLFDAVAALCGVRAQVGYEGQAAIELEALGASAPPPSAGQIYPMPLLDERPGPLVIDARETIRSIVEDLEDGIDAGSISARFHAALAAATVEAASRAAARAQLETVVLAGGVFQNRLLIEAVAAGLGERGLRPLIPRELPPGDGAISYGQVAIAAARHAAPGGELR